jgi:protein SCO1
MSKSQRPAAMLLLLSLSMLLPSVTFAQHHTHGAQAKQTTITKTADERERARKPGRIEFTLASVEIPDKWMIDQNGKQVRFYSDLIKDKVVVVNFFFTRCSYVCPMQGRSLSRLKDRLGERLGRDVFFISISKDPENDTPEELSKWGQRFGVNTGWTLVTGETEVIRKILWDFVGEEIGQAMHESTVLIGNDKTGVWTTTDGLLSPEDLIKYIDRVSRSDVASSIRP